MTNAFLGEERNIVTDVAGTTRDSIHSRYKKFDKEFLLIDTAGIRRKNKVHEDLEFYSVIRAVKSVEEADVCFLLLDATKGVESQDLAIFSLVIKRRKGLVILINKWDLVDKESNTAKEYETEIKRRIAPFNDVPVLFISVLEKQRIFKAIELGIEVFENRKRKVKTSELNEFMADIMEENPPPSHRGRFIKIKYATQIPVAYPSFAFFANHPEHVKTSYKQYIENQIRKRYNFTGAPMSIQIRKK